MQVSRTLQTLTMAAIVASLLCVPAGAALALLAFAVLGVSLLGFLTFGGALAVLPGLLVWWTLAFVASLVYAAFVLPGPNADAYLHAPAVRDDVAER